jgi:hypothetical protein
MVCPAGSLTFGVCVVSSADVLPLPDGSGGATGGAAGGHQDSITAAAGTVEAVGTGAAPARCQDARIFGAAGSSDRWLQVRTADNVLWTIGLRGFGDAPVVEAGDAVRFDLNYRRYTPTFAGPITQGLPRTDGYVQLSATAGTPLLWAGSNSYSATWLSFAMGQPLCDRTAGCPYTRYDVRATVDGSAATVAPFSTVNVAGYTLAVGEYGVPNLSLPTGSHTACAFEGSPPFVAAAVKAP